MAKKEKPIEEALQFKQEDSELAEEHGEPANTNKKIVELHAHPRFLGRQKKGNEGFNEDTFLDRMKSATRALDSSHQYSWNRVRKLSGNVLSDTEEGEQNFHELRTPRRKIDSQRARINQLRGRLHAAIRSGELAAPENIVPWHSGANEEMDEYRSHLALLQGNESRALIKEYTPLLRQLENLSDQETLRKFLDSLDERTHEIINLLQAVRQIEHDHLLFEQLFDEKKNPTFLKSFYDREHGREKKKTKPSKEKRERAAEREKARTETLPGAQMTWKFEWNGATIFLERYPTYWRVAKIHDPKRILSRKEIEETRDMTFTRFQDAPEWLREAARENGL